MASVKLSMITTAQFKNGIAIELEGIIYIIVSFQHHKPGKGGAFVRTKLRNLKSGAIVDKTFRAGERVQEVFLEEKRYQYLYRAGETYDFMDLETYEQISINKDILGEAVNFLKENIEITTSLYQGEIVAIALPIFVDLVVTETEVGVRGDTAKQATKPARLETGATVRVPLFIDKGDLVRVDTRTGEYAGRV